jgi:ArsR family transcriptional regulator
VEVKTSVVGRKAVAEGQCQTYCVDEVNVAAVREAMPADAVFEQCAEEFSAFSDPVRLKIIFALSHKELCVCDLATLLGRSMPATSQQLQRLRRMGLVNFTMSGKLAYYRLESSLARRLVRDGLKRNAQEDE